MACPSKVQQIAAIAQLLDLEESDERPLEDIAKQIVEGYHALLIKGLKSPASPARLGMLFKTPLDGKVRRYQWEGGGRVWIVGETDSYGWLGPLSGPLLEYSEEYHPSKMVETGKIKADGKPEKKRVPLTDKEIEEEWSNPDWQAGDTLSQHQRQYSFEIIATAPQSVLLRGTDGRLTVDSNSNLKQYYKREVKGLEGGW